jgi:hypothetical protein
MRLENVFLSAAIFRATNFSRNRPVHRQPCVPAVRAVRAVRAVLLDIILSYSTFNS